MKKLACLIVVLFFVTVGLGESDFVEDMARGADFIDIYLEEHPVTDDQGDVLISFQYFM